MSWRREWSPKRREPKIAPAAKPLVWIERGSPEYAAWMAHAAAEGREIIEYRSATLGSFGFFRRSKSPPASDEGSSR